MKIFLLLLTLVASSQAGSLVRSVTRESFESICEDAQTVSGFTTLRKADDLQFMLMCKAVDGQGKLEMGECHEADEFECFNAKGEFTADNEFGGASNCHPGQYLAGISSTYEEDSAAPENSVRKMKYKCCNFANAKVEEEIGCHHVDLPNPFDSDKPFGMMVNKIVASSSCQKDVMSALQITAVGFTVKYCPVTVEGADYESSCVEVIKKEVIEEYKRTFTETQTVTGEEMTVVQSKSETTETGTETEEGASDAPGEGTESPLEKSAEEAEEEEDCICVCGEQCSADGGEESETGGTDAPGDTDATTAASDTEGTTGGTEGTTGGETGDTEGTTGGTEGTEGTEGTTEAATTEGGSETTEAASGSDEDDSKRRAKRQTRTKTVKKTKTITRTKTITKTKTTRTMSKVTFTITTEKRKGMTVFVLAPSEKNELKQCDDCNCPASCPGADACDEGSESAEEEEDDEDSGSGECKTFGKGQCKKDGKCEDKCNSWVPGGGGDVEWDCDTGKCRCCYGGATP